LGQMPHLNVFARIEPVQYLPLGQVSVETRW
jgi:hypothetical protein